MDHILKFLRFYILYKEYPVAIIQTSVFSNKKPPFTVKYLMDSF